MKQLVQRCFLAGCKQVFPPDIDGRLLHDQGHITDLVELDEKEMKMLNDSEWLMPADAAAALGVHQTTLLRLARQGRITYVKSPGGYRKYWRKDIEVLKERRNRK